MSSYVLFQMWGPFRQSLIDEHLFYVEQARKRLLSQFDDIEAEADKAAKDWLEQNQIRFNPDQDDPGSFYEDAYEKGCEFYQLLSDMRDSTHLSVVAGMFHAWDKQLRDWLVIEMRHWHNGNITRSKIWSVDFEQIVDFLESLGWIIRDEKYFGKLESCRLVTNVYKHGDGKSFQDLKEKHPEYLAGLPGGTESRLLTRCIDHTDLKVSDKQITDFSDAIVAFWQSVPENIFTSQVTSVPKWFEKAIQNDRKQHSARK